MALRGSRPILTVVFVLFAFIAAADGQTIWYVDAANCPGPGDGSQGNPFCKIQDAINTAAANATPPDEIVVADGIYTGTGNKNLDFNGKTINLHSANGAENCVIDCEGDGRGFYFHGGETNGACVDGITIRNGKITSNSPGGARGGGVYCDSSSPTLTNCTISGNKVSGGYAGLGGGGVYCANSNPRLINCRLNGNSAYGVLPSGGALFCASSSPTLVDCTISGNTVYGSPMVRGGGVSCWHSSSAELTNCTISGNTASGSGFGGGLHCYSSASPTLIGCTINGNTALEGGGLYCNSSSPTLTGCDITANTASQGGGVSCYSSSSPTLLGCRINGNTASFGGGVYFRPSSCATLRNCTIIANKAIGSTSSCGGGVSCSDSTPIMANCTILGNLADSSGGGMYCDSLSIPTLTNCILWSDTPQEIYVSTGMPVVTYCTVQDGYEGEGNIDADPLFIDAASGNFRLAASSPCIDVGSNAAVPAGVMTDLEGNPRILPGHPVHVTLPRPGQPIPPSPAPVVDMGAYEFKIAPLPEPDEVPIGGPVVRPDVKLRGRGR